MFRLIATVTLTSALCAAAYVATDRWGEVDPERVFDPPLVVADDRAPEGALVTDTAWPSVLAKLAPPEITLPPRGRKWRIYIDAGHGAKNNSGAVSSFCEDEQDHSLRVAEFLANELTKTGRFTVRLSRRGEQRPSYPTRVAEANAWPADAFISIHMDWRGGSTYWEPIPGKQCLRQDAAPGFGVLWNDETSDDALREQRHTLARIVSKRIAETGFTPYDGFFWYGLYDGDETPGVFVDRHPPGSRIYVLLRPKVPSILIETNNSLDVREATRWREGRTLHAFSQAVIAGLGDFFAAQKTEELHASVTPKP